MEQIIWYYKQIDLFEKVMRVIALVLNPFGMIILYIIVVTIFCLVYCIRDYTAVQINKLKLKNVKYYRNIESNILLYCGGIDGAFGIKCNILSYILLDFISKRWLTYERIGVDKYVYKLGNQFPNFEGDAVIEELYHIIIYAMNDDYTLDPDELLNYVKSKIGQIRLCWVKTEIMKRSYKYFWEKNYAKHNRNNSNAILNPNLRRFIGTSFTKEGLIALEPVYGLYKYIKDYTLLNEKGIESESYWEDLFKYAVFFNQAKKIKDMIKQKKVEMECINIATDLMVEIYMNKNIEEMIERIKIEYEDHKKRSQELLEKRKKQLN